VSARAWRALVGKELRVLGPVWVATMSLMGLAMFADSREGYQIAGPAYVVGALALGALAVGQEYHHRTLAALLMQPVARRTLLRAKLLVLGVLLGALCAGALLLIRNAPLFQLSGQEIAGRLRIRPTRVDPTSVWLLLPVLYGLCVAPWMTMVSRGVLAGVVLTAALPALTWLALETALQGVYGLGRLPAEIEAMRLRALWLGSLAICGVGAILTWVLFARLQAIEGSPEVRLPAGLTRWVSARAARPTTRRPVWLLLVAKEIRLQQMALAVAALYLLMCGAMFTLEPVIPDLMPRLVSGISILYSLGIAVLIGSFASAEERRLGTLHWQLLLPTAAWRQWIAKVLTAVTLLGVLAMALPMFVLPLLTDELWTRDGVEPVVLTMLMLLALYISSLSNSGLRGLVHAALLAGLVPLGVALSQPVLRPVGRVIGRAVGSVTHDMLNARWPTGVDVHLFRLLNEVASWMVSGFLAGAFVLLLWFAFLNHQADSRPARGRVQALTLGCTLLIVACLGALMSAVHYEVMLHSPLYARSPDSHISQPAR
jgi:hypothetical protein